MVTVLGIYDIVVATKPCVHVTHNKPDLYQSQITNWEKFKVLHTRRCWSGDFLYKPANANVFSNKAKFIIFSSKRNQSFFIVKRKKRNKTKIIGAHKMRWRSGQCSFIINFVFELLYWTFIAESRKKVTLRQCYIGLDLHCCQWREEKNQPQEI